MLKPVIMTDHLHPPVEFATYTYLSLVESARIEGRVTHRTLLRLGEISTLRDSGQLGRIIAAL